ncbi:MAG: hypothetical protein WCJ39_03165 [bacterium]
MGNAADMMNPSLGKWVAIIGFLVVLFGLCRLALRHGKDIWKEKKSYVSYIGIWALVCLASLIIFK